MTAPVKVFLINLAGHFLTGNSFVPDNSLGTLASALMAQGAEVEILDFQGPRELGEVMDQARPDNARAVTRALDGGELLQASLVQAYHHDREQAENAVFGARIRALLDRIETERVSLVGFKLWVGPGLRWAVRIAEAVKQAFPRVKVVAGGPAVLYFSGELSRLSDAFDYLIAGEGEAILPALALGRDRVAAPECLPPFQRVLRPVVQDIQALPFPRYDRAVYRNIDTFFSLRILDESRGCPNRCHFCAHNTLNGGSVRLRRATAIVDEIQRLNEEESITYFRLSGSNPPMWLLGEIAREILQRGLRVCYSAYASMRGAQPEQFALLFRSGLRALFFGVESGAPELLDRAHGKQNGSIEHVEYVADAAMDAGIFVALSFITPAPFETPWTRRATLNLIERIFSGHRHGSVLVLPPYLYPGTAWWERMEQFGFEFAPGMDRSAYSRQLLTAPVDFLLPRDSWKEMGVVLNGKRWGELLTICEDFSREVRGMGIITNLDDASYMLALMANVEPGRFQQSMLRALLVNGAGDLQALVSGYNVQATKAREFCPAA